MWFSLIRTASYRPARWLWAPPALTAAFSSARSPGVVLRVSSTFAGVPSSSAHRPRGRRGHPREVGQEVERRALSGEQRTGASAQPQHRVPLLAPDALLDLARDLDLRVEQLEDQLRRPQAVDHPGLLLDDQAPAPAPPAGPSRASSHRRRRGPPAARPGRARCRSSSTGYSPEAARCSSRARTKPSRSPSSTRWTSPTSSPVRWSLTIE